MANLKISTQLSLLLAGAAAALAIVGTSGWLGTQLNEQSLRAVYEDHLVPVTLLGSIESNMLRNRVELEVAADDPRPERAAQAAHTVEANIVAISKAWEAYAASPMSPEKADLAKHFTALRGQFVNEGLKPTLAALKAGDAEKARLLVSQTLPKLYAPASAASDGLIEMHKRLAKAAHEEAITRDSRLLAAIVGVTVLAVLASTLIGLWVARRITRALGAEPHELRQYTDAVAKGELGVTIVVKDGDDASVLASLKKMVEQLSKSVGTVRRNADQLATAAAEIAQGNMDLSGRTEQQAAALQETASSMEELGSTVKQNADNARQANQLAMSASSVAVQGGDVVAQVVDTMKGINDSSKKIADIIAVIDGIAFQTNILALNAAVEAARAGEQGRGFAVVAGEVRSLAQRSAEAAKEIKGLITASVERVGQGTQLVDRAGQTMQEVVASIKRVTDIMGEISAASAEQSAGVAQVGQAITQMDQTTQQNAALVEQSAAAAESLKTQAQQLVQAVTAFRLAGSGGVNEGAGGQRQAAEHRPPGRAPHDPAGFHGQARTRAPAALPAPAAASGAAVGAASAMAAAGADDDWATF